MTTTKTLFITGVSSGFGHALAKAALAAGHRVIGTVRKEADLHAFQALSVDNAYGVMLDVTDFDRIDEVIAQVEATHGPVDVLINNAGYGHEGLFEESPLEDMRRQFDVNVFGAVAVIKASGKQLGDPQKAAQAMLQIIASPTPPAHVLLGSDALRLVREKLKHVGDEIDQWEALTRSTDH